MLEFESIARKLECNSKFDFENLDFDFELGACRVPVEANGVNPGYLGCQSSFTTQDYEK